MVIVVGIALSVHLSGQLFTHLYHTLFPLHRSALSDWHVSEEWEADIQHAVGQAMLEYQDQLSSRQSDLQQRDREHQQSI